MRQLNDEEISSLFTIYLRQRDISFEIALIVDPSDTEKVKKSTAFLQESFPGQIYQQWSGVHADRCPTINPLGMDEWHPAAKLVGIAMAHKRIWEEFLFTDSSTDEDAYLIIFEDDALCAVDRCGDLAIEQIRLNSFR